MLFYEVSGYFWDIMIFSGFQAEWQVFHVIGATNKYTNYEKKKIKKEFLNTYIDSSYLFLFARRHW